VTSDQDLAQARAAVVSAAKRLLAGEIGVVEAAREIARNGHVLDPDMQDPELVGFLAIDSESDRLILERVIHEWHPSLHAAKRQEFRDFESFYREDALQDAAVLVERYSRPPNER
jgi:hypothetical protein